MAWITTDDPVDDFLRYDAEREAEDGPRCDECGCLLEEMAYHINGEWLCDDCVKDLYREVVRDD